MDRGRFRPWATVLAAVMVTSACGSPVVDRTARPSPPTRSVEPRQDETAQPSGQPAASAEIMVPQYEPTTAWERVLSGIERNGQVPLETAMAAFSLAVAPLPGVEVPPGEPEFIGSGSGPIRWVLGHWDELTDEQRAAVTAHLTAGEPSFTIVAGRSSGLIASIDGRPPGPMKPSLDAAQEEVESAVQEAIATIEGKLGRALLLTTFTGASRRIPVEVVFDVPSTEIWAETAALDAFGQPAVTGQMSVCQIGFTAAMSQLTGPDLVAIASHEVFHCYQYALDALEVVFRTGPWLHEGSAAWVGEVLAGGSLGVGGFYWRYWLTYPGIPLFTRIYDGMGFFSHLDEHGTDPWKILDAMHRAASSSSVDAYMIATTTPNADEVIDEWGPSYFRELGLDDIAWDIRTSGVSPVRTPVTPLTIEPGAAVVVGTPWQSGWPVRIALSGEVFVLKPLLPDVSTRGRIRFSDATEYPLAEAVGTPICLRGSCACPAGSKGAAHAFKKGATGETRLGLTGHTDYAPVELAAFELDTFCDTVSPADLAPEAPCFCPKIVPSIRQP